MDCFFPFPVKTNHVQKTHEMYHLVSDAFGHYHHLPFNWLSYSDVLITETTQILTHTHTRESAEKLVPSIMVAQVLD